MDQQLKARLIGAVILVVIAVLLIPELLSGRKPAAVEETAPGTQSGTRTYTIDLTGNSSAATVEPSPASAPVVTGAPAADELRQPLAGPAPEPEAVADQPAPHAGPPPAAAPAATTSATPATTTAQDAAKPPASSSAATPKPASGQATAASHPPPAAAAVAPPAASTKSVKGGWSVQVGAFGAAGTAGKLVSDLKAAGYGAYVSPIVKGGKTLHRVRVGPEAARVDADKLAAKMKARGLPATVVAND